ncbi:MAG: hypothetical protein AUK47_22475 [Deltaproteobacteria bacterium CG2_30_63_29]|nr:MAG: hypothetical protein AUK47_22475 [Deltaproteobacteria bacterium CG2_30_63_29]PJB40865.1 MAG: hypothetical protein CO108_13940 [Deltaproteobacteria bacterium CG_4_9_14_3_um_filter_63_12]
MSVDKKREYDIGDMIAGRYVVFTVGGAGPNGATYESRDMTTQKWVSIRVLHDPDPGTQAIASFIADTKELRQLESPAIIPIVEAGVIDRGIRYLVYEQPEGELLADVLKEGPLTLAETTRLMTRVAEGLWEAHRKQLHHGGLTPHNLILASQGLHRTAKLWEFGVSRHCYDSRTHTLNFVNEFKDDPPMPPSRYLAPEVLKGQPTSPQSDIYQWALVFVECLLGEPALYGGSLDEIRDSQESFNLVKVVPSLVGKDICGVLLNALATNPANRIANAKALLAALENKGEEFSNAERPTPAFTRETTRPAIAAEMVRPLAEFTSAEGAKSFGDSETESAEGAKSFGDSETEWLDALGSEMDDDELLPPPAAALLDFAGGKDDPWTSPGDDEVDPHLDLDAIDKAPPKPSTIEITPEELEKLAEVKVPKRPPPSPSKSKLQEPDALMAKPATLELSADDLDKLVDIAIPKKPPPPPSSISGIVTVVEPVVSAQVALEGVDVIVDDEQGEEVTRAGEVVEQEGPARDEEAVKRAVPAQDGEKRAVPAQDGEPAEPNRAEEVVEQEEPAQPAKPASVAKDKSSTPTPLAAEGVRTSKPSSPSAPAAVPEKSPPVSSTKATVKAKFESAEFLRSPTPPAPVAAQSKQIDLDALPSSAAERSDDDDDSGSEFKPPPRNYAIWGIVAVIVLILAVVVFITVTKKDDKTEKPPATQAATSSSTKHDVAEELDIKEEQALVGDVQEEVAVAAAPDGGSAQEEDVADTTTTVAMADTNPTQPEEDVSKPVADAGLTPPSTTGPCAGASAEACIAKARKASSGVWSGRDEAKATLMFAAACEAGLQDACAEVGMRLSSGRGQATASPERAYPLVSAACGAGSQLGCLYQAQLLYAGIGVARSLKDGAKLFATTCDAGSSRACVWLGIATDRGKGVKRDLKKSAQLQQTACDAGDGMGCGQLGEKHRKGRGVPKDAEKRLELLQLGCDKRDGESCYELAEQFRSDGNTEKSGEFWERGCDGDFAEACTKLCYLHQSSGLPGTNRETALPICEAACELGDAKGCYRAAVFLNAGVGEGSGKAHEYLVRACNGGEAKACAKVH